MDKLVLTTLAIYAANVIDAGFVRLGESPGLAKVSLAPAFGPRGTGSRSTSATDFLTRASRGARGVRNRHTPSDPPRVARSSQP